VFFGQDHSYDAPAPLSQHNLNDAVAIGASRPIAIPRDFDWHHGAAFGFRPPPSAAAAAAIGTAGCC